MRRLPDEAGGTGSVPSSPGQPRGTQFDHGITPQEPNRASRDTAPAPTDRSSGSRQHARRPHPTAAQVATALADAFLAAAAPSATASPAAAWTTVALVRAGTACLGSRRRFLSGVVAAVLEAHHRPPHDAPRELASLILRSPGFADAVGRAARRRPVLIAQHLVVATRSRPTSDRIPRLDTVADLARALDVDVGHLDWFADTGQWNRRAKDSALQHYRYEWRARPGRVPRLLEVPGDRLRALQRVVLDEILAPIPLNDAAHGFVPGRSALTGARLHTGRDVVVSLDLVSFFARVTGRRCFSILRQAGYPEPVAYSLTGLCTHVVPPRILSAMPPGGTASERWALRRALSTPHLPQGAPSSPAMANLTLRRLDSRLTGWARGAGAAYTRYADDLSFSGDEPFAARADAFLRGAARIVADEGHSLNAGKTRVRRRGVRQTVTGIVVNETTNVGRADYDRLRAILHNCVVDGAASQDRGDHADFRAHLLGMVAWVGSTNAARGERLRAEFDRVTW